MANVYDRVKVATSTTGTGTITLGGAHPGFRTFGTAVGGNDTVYYVIEDGTAWEIGTGLFTLGTSTLTRSVIASTNSNTAINLTGNAVVFSSLPKELIDDKASKITPNFTGPVQIDSVKVVDENYIVSRKNNLVTNGTAHMANNYNFTGFTYSAADGLYTKGCFTVTGDGASIKTSDLMPVNPLLRHSLGLSMKASPSVGATHTVSLAFYDPDGLEILPIHVGFSTGTTTLAQNLDPDDTTIVLTNSTGWNAATSGDTTQRGMIVWNYTSAGGQTFAAGTYSRNAYPNLWSADASVNTGTHTITLSSPWAGPFIAAGTTVSRSRGAATFTPVAVSAVAVPNTWTNYSGFIEGVDTAGTHTAGKFPPGTAYAKVSFSLNNGTTGGGVKVTNVAFAQAYEASLAAGTTSQYYRGDKTWQTLDKTAVGLGSVDNTADSAKNVATAVTLANSRNFSISGGGITASAVGFTGAANVTLSASVDAAHITLARMANLAANSIIGNNTGSAATPLALTGTQITAMLDNFTSALKGLVPLSGGGTTNFLRADGTWAAPPGGGGSVSDTAYAVGWNGSTTTAPSQNAVYDKIEAMISDTAYAGSWDTVTTVAPSKNAVYDAMELRAPKASPTFTGTVNAATITASANISGVDITGSGNVIGTTTVISGNAVVSRGGASEGGQFVLGYGNSAATGIVGQANSTWNIDVDSSEALRVFRQNSSGVSLVPLTIAESTGACTFGAPLYTIASASGAAGLRLPHGAAPSSPTNGDLWTTTTGVYARINSSTVRVDNASHAIVMHINGGGAAIVAGQQFDLPSVPFDCTVTGWTITGDASGSAVVDIQRATYANFPTMTSIAGSEKPTLSSAQKNQDLALSSWTTSLTAGDVLRANVDSASTVEALTITIWVTRT